MASWFVGRDADCFLAAPLLKSTTELLSRSCHRVLPLFTEKNSVELAILKDEIGSTG